MRVHRLPGLRPAADPVGLRVPIRHRPGDVRCLIEKAVAQRPHRSNAVWWECQTCGQPFTGAMRTGLAEAWWSRVCDESEERLNAAGNLAVARERDGQYAEAERINREVLGVQRQVLGEEHPETLTSANNMAQSLSGQGKHSEPQSRRRRRSTGRCLVR